MIVRCSKLVDGQSCFPPLVKISVRTCVFQGTKLTLAISNRYCPMIVPLPECGGIRGRERESLELDDASENRLAPACPRFTSVGSRGGDISLD